MISHAISMGRAPSIASPPFMLQALGCVAMALVCDLCGLLHTETVASPWPGVPICHTGGVDWVSAFGAGLSMGLIMMLVSLAPLRWTGVMSLSGVVTALLWVIGNGVLQASIQAVDQMASASSGTLPSAVPRLILLALSMAAALHVSGRPGFSIHASRPLPSPPAGEGGAQRRMRGRASLDIAARPLIRLSPAAKSTFSRRGRRVTEHFNPICDYESGRAGGAVKRPTFRDGAHCFLRCGPMMAAMMLTGTMSLPWVIAGALVTQLDEAVGDPRLSRLLTCGIGVAATVGML